MRHAWFQISLAVALVGIAVSGCPSTSNRPCNTDRDCFPNESCMTGVGCVVRDDAGVAPAADAAGGCTDAAGCDDHLFCNGPETCAAGRCTAGTPPCAADACDETADRCRTLVVDFDHDNDPAMTDCDDNDPTRHHGNEETCDSVDNDCDPSTVGPDIDGDHVARTGCCNAQADGSMLCGTDCNDNQATVNPAANEIPCNGADDNCNGTVDEGILPTFYVDADGDHYGSDATMMMACTRPPGYADNNRDCDDSNDLVNPDRLDLCGNAVDDNCNGMADEGCNCMPSYGSRMCCSGRGTQMCVMNATGWDWDTCTATSGTEICNNMDDDCDGTIDEATAANAYCNGRTPGQSCVNHACVCASGYEVCGGRCQDSRAHAACDGSDADVCVEGHYACNGTSVVCDDNSGDSGSGSRQCNSDLDCDGNSYENLTGGNDCSPINATGTCYICGGGFGSTPMSRGSHRCGTDCTWGGCSPEGSTYYDPATFASGASGTLWPTTCSGMSAWGNGSTIPYGPGGSCGVGYAIGVFPTGTYDVTVLNHDDGNYWTSLFDVQAYQYSTSVGAAVTTSVVSTGSGFCRAGPGYRECGSTTANDTYFVFRFVVTGCGSIAISFGERPDGGYIGGNHLRITRIDKVG